jgi:hypothetical protein
MSCLIVTSAAAAVATVTTVLAATLPDAQALLAPLADGNEYALSSVSILASVPILAVMTVLAASGRE